MNQDSFVCHKTTLRCLTITQRGLLRYLQLTKTPLGPGIAQGTNNACNRPFSCSIDIVWVVPSPGGRRCYLPLDVICIGTRNTLSDQHTQDSPKKYLQINGTNPFQLTKTTL